MAVENLLWTERYRPHSIKDTILPERLKKEFQKFIDEGEIPHMLLTGPAGTGKTTVAQALAEEIGADFYLLNGSVENGKADMQTKVESYAATLSVMSDAKIKIMCIDEADGLSAEAQKALRGMIEKYSNNCRFIFTCNYETRIIDAIHSRCTTIKFGLSNSEKKALMAGFFKRVSQILGENEIEFEPKALAAFIQSMFPDFRKTLNELQRYSKLGSIDSGILRITSEEQVQECVKFLKEKDFRSMRSWVDSNPTLEVTSFFDKLYTRLPDYITPQSQPELILVLDEYQTKALTAINPKINIAACMVTLMASLEWKND